MLLSLLLLLANGATATTRGPAVETWAPTVPDLVVRTSPERGASRRGLLVEDEPFVVIAHVLAAGCDDWAMVQAQGFVCLDHAEQVDAPTVALPRPIAFEPPFPDDYAEYLRTGAWTRRGTSESALLPFVYARAWHRHGKKSRLYADSDAFVAGEVGRARLPAGDSLRFVRTITAPDGRVGLVRDDGTVVAEDDVYIFPVDRFEGWDLKLEPVPEGMQPGFAVSYLGANVYDRVVPLKRYALSDVPASMVLPYHSRIVVEEVAGHDGWWRIRDALGPGKHGFVEDHRGVRVWRPEPVPPEVGEGELWLDVHLGQQILAVRRDEKIERLTLVSTGLAGTPAGTYRIQDKAVWWDMRSRPDAEDPYFVEAVPWTLHFKPRYALHGTYWHWGAGHRASHGCVNVPPIEARWVFEHTEPALPRGWRAIWATDEDPGTVLRIRK